MSQLDALRLAALKSLPAEQINPADILAVCENKPDAFKAQVVEILRAKGLILPAGNMQPELEKTLDLPSPDPVQAEYTPLALDREPTSYMLKVDPGLSPLARRNGGIALFRLWIIAQHINRSQHNGRNYVTRDELAAYLPQARVTISPRQFRRQLQQGHGQYWRLHNERVYLIGTKALWRNFTATLCQRNLHTLAEAMKPRNPVYVDIGGSLEDVTRALYAAWIDTRQGDGELTVSRVFICKVWDCSPNTLRAWEQGAVNARPNYAQYGGNDDTFIPAHAAPYITQEGQVKHTWRHTNTYSSIDPVPEHRHKGQTSKARQARNRVLRSESLNAYPADECPAAIQNTKRLTFDNVDGNGFNQARQHLRKHGDYNRRHYVKLGTKTGYGTQRQTVGLFECYDPASAGNALTSLQERNFTAEHTPQFEQMKGHYHAYFQSR